MIPTVHLTPSILNGWEELRTANDDSPKWVTPEEFKKSIVGDYAPSLKAEAGNAVHGMVFEGWRDHSKEYLTKFKPDDKRIIIPKYSIWNYRVSDRFLEFRKMFPFGTGVSEVSKTKYFPEQIEGCIVRVSARFDYLSVGLTTELKTSSKPFSRKGTIRGFLESQQSFCYTWIEDQPIRFLFAEIDIDDDQNPMFIDLKRADSSTAYPCSDSDSRLYNCVRSLIPYLREDEQLWTRVTTRKLQDEF